MDGLRSRQTWLAGAVGVGLAVAVSRTDQWPADMAVGVAGFVLVLGLNTASRTDTVTRLTAWLGLLVLIGVSEPRTAAQVLADPTSTLNIVKGAVAGGALLIVAASRRVSLIPRTRTEVLLALYLAVIIASAIWSINPASTLLAALRLLIAYLLVLVLARLRLGSLSRIVQDIATAAYVLVLSTLAGLVVAPAFAFSTTSEFDPVRRLRGLVPDVSSNMVGYVSAIAIVTLIARVGPKWTTGSLPRLGLLSCSTVALLLCRSRASMALVLIGVVALLAWSPRRRVILLLGAPIVIGGLLLAASTVQARLVPYLARGQTTSELRTLTGRIPTWQAALGLWTERPLLGYGYYAGHRFGPLEDVIGREVSNLDNMWIETLLDVGGLGMLPLAGFVCLGSARISRDQSMSPAVKTLALMSLVASFYNPSLQTPTYAMLAWSLLLLAFTQPAWRSAVRGTSMAPRSLHKPWV